MQNPPARSALNTQPSTCMTAGSESLFGFVALEVASIFVNNVFGPGVVSSDSAESMLQTIVDVNN